MKGSPLLLAAALLAVGSLAAFAQAPVPPAMPPAGMQTRGAVPGLEYLDDRQLLAALRDHRAALIGAGTREARIIAYGARERVRAEAVQPRFPANKTVDTQKPGP